MAMKQTVIVEVLMASGCSRCQRLKALAREVIAGFDDKYVQYREIDVVEEIDYAVRLGVTTTPAIALNGKLIFPAMPSKTRLYQAIQLRLAV